MKVLVLSGGGYKGIFQAGVLMAMKETYDMVFGTSVGALNALLCSCDGKTFGIWGEVLKGKRFHSSGIMNYIDVVLKKKLGIYKNNLYVELIKFLEKNRIIRPFHVTVVDIDGGEIYYVEIPSDGKSIVFEDSNGNVVLTAQATKENIANIITASTTIPGAFEPIRFRPNPRGTEYLLVDGGVRDKNPLAGAVSYCKQCQGDSEITIIMCSPQEIGKAGKLNRLDRVILRSIDLLSNEVALEDVSKFELYNELAEKFQKEGAKYIKLTKIIPDYYLIKDSLDPTKEELEKAYMHGIEKGSSLKK